MKEIQTRIISAFPGVGKTTFYNNNRKSTLDSDSSGFSWIYRDTKKIRNPDFPDNYIKYIKGNVGKYEFILVSSHKEVRDALKQNCLHFYLVYPNKMDKCEYIKRYKERGNSQSFIKLLDENWDLWLRQCYFEIRCSHQKMCPGWYLENAISHIICSESGEK